MAGCGMAAFGVKIVKLTDGVRRLLVSESFVRAQKWIQQIRS